MLFARPLSTGSKSIFKVLRGYLDRSRMLFQNIVARALMAHLPGWAEWENSQDGPSGRIHSISQETNFMYKYIVLCITNTSSLNHSMNCFLKRCKHASNPKQDKRKSREWLFRESCLENCGYFGGLFWSILNFAWSKGHCLSRFYGLSNPWSLKLVKLNLRKMHCDHWAA